MWCGDKDRICAHFGNLDQAGTIELHSKGNFHARITITAQHNPQHNLGASLLKQHPSNTTSGLCITQQCTCLST